MGDDLDVKGCQSSPHRNGEPIEFVAYSRPCRTVERSLASYTFAHIAIYRPLLYIGASL